MRTRLVVALLAILFCGFGVQAQTTCPTGYDIATGFKVQDPTAAAGTFIYPMCVSKSNGSVKFQGDILAQTDITSKTSTHLVLNTTTDSTQVRINSRSFTQATGDSIGFQSKPSQTVTTTGSVFGGQISPRLQSGIAAANIIGLDVNSDLKGTAAGTVSGDVRALNLELVTDDAGTRTISGDVTHIRLRSAFSATTITGNFTAIKIEKPEAQTNSKTYTAVLNLTSTIPGVWNNAPGTEPSTADGYLKIIVNGSVRYIQLYSGAPVD